MRCGKRLPGRTPDLLKVDHVLAKLPSLPEEHEHRIRTLLYVCHASHCARLHSTDWVGDARLHRFSVATKPLRKCHHQVQHLMAYMD